MLRLKLALKELLHQRLFSLFFVLGLSLGLFGFLIIESVQGSLNQEINQRKQSLLAADLSLSSRIPLMEEQLTFIQKSLPPKTETGFVQSTYSMARSEKTSRLVNIKAIDSSYPFYGEVQLDNIKTAKQPQFQSLQTNQVIWVYPEILAQFELKKDDSLKIGNTLFKIEHVILDDPGGGGLSSFSLAPSIYMSRDHLKETGLIDQGTLMTHNFLAKLSQITDKDLDALAKFLETSLNQPGLSVETRTNSSNRLKWASQSINDYLGLVVLVGLLLAGLGAGYLIRSLLTLQRRSHVLYSFLGISVREVKQIILFQMVILGSIATGLAVLTTYFLLPGIAPLFQKFLPYQLIPHITVESTLVTLLIGILGSLFTALPSLNLISQAKPIVLLENNTNVDKSFRAQDWFSFIPLVIFYGGLAFYQTQSWRLTGIFIAATLGGSFTLLALGRFILIRLSKSAHRFKLNLKLTFLNASRQPMATLACFLAIGLGSLLLNVIPQVQQVFQKEFSTDGTIKRPSLFLFDIQKEQLQLVEDVLKTQNQSLDLLTPFIRGRLIKINDEDFERYTKESFVESREEQNDKWVRNRSLNLTYRKKHLEGETVIQGIPIETPYLADSKELPLVSVEKWWASELGIKIGDTLTFDVQGLPIKSKVANIRKVSWSKFNPSFFVEFQDGVLNDAPQTFIAGILGLNEKQAIETQNLIVKTFPNISLIDVRRVVSKALNLFDDLSLAIWVMAFLAILSGLVVLYAIARQQAFLREKDNNLYKILGLSLKRIQAMTVVEFAGLGSLASLVGAFLSIALSYSVLVFVFDREWFLSPLPLLMTWLVISLQSAIIAFWATRGLLRKKPFLS